MTVIFTKRTSSDVRSVVANGRKADMAVASADFRICRVGPGNFTPSLSQIRT